MVTASVEALTAASSHVCTRGRARVCVVRISEWLVALADVILVHVARIGAIHVVFIISAVMTVPHTNNHWNIIWLWLSCRQVTFHFFGDDEKEPCGHWIPRDTCQVYVQRLSRERLVEIVELGRGDVISQNAVVNEEDSCLVGELFPEVVETLIPRNSEHVDVTEWMQRLHCDSMNQHIFALVSVFTKSSSVILGVNHESSTVS